MTYHTLAEINQADRTILEAIKHDLTIHKMYMDKQFSIFLDASLEESTDDDHFDWPTYKQLMAEYEHTEYLIRTVDYRLSHC
jgi:hypothetical protein